ncbi:MAG: ATP-binding cassette domain-containing protein [Myxococcales bacterium]|nr:ATP-binding cassette domain-containing protein [Myxococcales bacterium]
MPALSLESVSAGDPAYPAIEGLDLRVGRGETVVLSAPRGHGLDLLPGLISGQVAPLSGAVTLLGQRLSCLGPTELRALRFRCGFVPARGLLLANHTVHDNLALPLRYHGVAENEVLARVAEALDRHRLRHLADRRPAQLTRAQARWAAMVRAHLTRAEVVVVHEPFEGMDEAASERLERLLRDWVGDDGRAVLLTTHATSLDASYGGRLAHLDARVATWVRRDTSIPGAPSR